MRKHSRQRLRDLFPYVAAALLALTAAGEGAAQSSDVSFPAPIFSNEVTGRIAPRDVGDPRRTRHFYTFRGTEGDLVVTLDSNELSGDVDVFTATTLRPLLKITLYGGSPTRASKSVYLRGDETLILRVEARAVGDIEGTYRVRFEGAFRPAPSDLAQAPEAPSLPAADAARRGTRRVTATGERIPEPVVVPSLEEAKAEPTPTPAEATDSRAEERPAASTPSRSRAGRGARSTAGRGRGARRGTQPAEPAERSDIPATPTEPPADAERETPARSAPPPRRPTRRGSRSSRRNAPADRATTEAAPPADAASPATPAPAPPQRLIIVTRDGETLERDMSTVRRVTVENNNVVIVTKDGRVIRQPMANVLRMSIEP